MTARDPGPGHAERHAAARSGWLRAAVLGANDGLVSLGSLLVGLVASGVGPGVVVTGGIAALAAGAGSMAAGEYVSVSTQTDVERADRRREVAELAADPEGELEELAALYRERGLAPELAHEVAVALHAHDPLAAHLRDELGQSDLTAARPLQAAAASAASFTVGALVPLLLVVVGMPHLDRPGTLAVAVLGTLAGLAAAGLLSARASGIAPARPVLRVLLGGGAAMAVTAAIGQVAGVAV